MWRIEWGLGLLAVVLAVTGIFTETVWVLGVGAWMLIAACLIDMVYRPCQQTPHTSTRSPTVRVH
ncbi:hypothetical protein AA958_27090 [Streptomyces sp. CNQ-509]|uniref:hypothetical protein n=1 Tax=Streptomyces sp. B22F1 TaxID=3153566 RepID=UPI00062DEDDA|nr:hypothetical protein AA958_27090 [Streptomyces sp. CNQ-509]